jgi:hypothetical protein
MGEAKLAIRRTTDCRLMAIFPNIVTLASISYQQVIQSPKGMT